MPVPQRRPVVRRPRPEIVKAELGGVCDEITTDKVGNLIARIAPKKRNPRGRILLAAHMDEPGFMVKNIDGDGRLRLSLLGNLDTRTLSGRRVTLVSGVRGVVSAKPIHAQSGDERSKPTLADKLYIELGAKDKAEAEALVRLGDYGRSSRNSLLLQTDFTPARRSADAPCARSSVSLRRKSGEKGLTPR